MPANQLADYSNTGLRIMFSRNVSTFDDYDKKLSSTFIFCLHIYAQGSISSEVSDKSCEIVELSYSYVRDEIRNSFGDNAQACMVVVLGLMLLLWQS